MEQRRSLLGAGPREWRLEQLAHHAERKLLLEIAARSAEHLHTGPLGHTAGRLQQGGLADARGPPNHQQAAVRRCRLSGSLSCIR